MNNDTISIEKAPFVSIKELNTVLKELPRFVKGDQVTLDFKQKIERIDIAFMAGLILAAKENDLKFWIQKNGDIDKIEETGQYLVTFEAIYGNELNFLLGSTFGNFDFLKYQHVNKKGETVSVNAKRKANFIASSSFAPLFYVSEDTIQLLFNPPLDTIFSAISKKYIEKVVDIGTPSAKSKNEESQIFKILGIHSKSIVFISTYYILASKLKLFGGLDRTELLFDEQYREEEQRARSLWEFTEAYVSGLQELAKNIVEHSITKHGMITIRAYDRPDEETEVRNPKVLETHVFDFGKEGIVENLIKSTKENMSKGIVPHLYEKDHEMLTSTENPFFLKNFIEPTHENQLNQQLFREIAHYGLMKFYGLIKSNRGDVFCVSRGLNDGSDSYSSRETSDYSLIEHGTTYFFLLPFVQENFKVIESSEKTEQLSEYPPSIDGLTHLLTDGNEIKKWQIIPLKEIGTDITDRQKENHFIDEIEEKIEGTSEYFFLDFNEIVLYPSNLLRIAAQLSQKYEKSFVFYNLKYKIFFEMIEDNYRYIRNMVSHSDTPFWFENKSILFYTQPDGRSFNFADLLFGQNIEEFHSANQLVSLSFPNATTIVVGKESHAKPDFMPVGCLDKIFYKSALLPFDLLLQGNENMLFIENMSTILNLELIKPT